MTPDPTPDPPDDDPAPLWAVACVLLLVLIAGGCFAATLCGCNVPQFGTGRAP